MDVRKTQALRDILKDKSLLKDKCYIDGTWVGGAGTINVTNPVDESVICSVPRLGAKETKHAIEAAERAQKDWAKKTAKERSAILRKWFTLMMENQEDLAQIMTAEQGKPLAESRGEIGYGASFIEFFAEEARRIYGETIPSPFANGRMVVIKQAVGVVAAITPWNFPNAMIARKAGPALAAGCAFVCKPASETPLSALGHGRTGAPRRNSRRRFLGDHRFRPRDRRGNDRKPHRPRPDLYRLDGNRPPAHGPVRPYHQEARP